MSKSPTMPNPADLVPGLERAHSIAESMHEGARIALADARQAQAIANSAEIEAGRIRYAIERELAKARAEAEGK